MENFKLNLTQLTPVAEKDRIKGNFYFVCDRMNQSARLQQFKEKDEDIEGCPWKHWFAIPPNLPGFPKAELLDEFELKDGEWEAVLTNQVDRWELTPGMKYRRIKSFPELTIPSGTRSEQIEAVKKILEELETK